MDTKQIAYNNLIFETLTGSIAYGTNLPSSDTDYRGIFVAPKENVITGLFPIEQYQDPVEDRVFYELRKFLKLLSDQNPNILELLWVNDEHITKRTDTYDMLRNMREELLSSKVKYTFSGYAHSQLNRLKNHNKWVNKPQDKESPKQRDFIKVKQGVKAFDTSILEGMGEGYGFYSLHGEVLVISPKTDYNLFTEKGEVNVQEKYADQEIIGMVVYNKTEYTGALNEWKGYWEWRGNRNKDRLANEDEYGYDTKHAMHSIRLLRMGKEILRDGVVNVFREDAQELLDIRNGVYSLEEILEMSDGLIADIDSLYETTELRKKVDYKMVSNLILDVYESHWS